MMPKRSPSVSGGKHAALGYAQDRARRRLSRRVQAGVAVTRDYVSGRIVPADESTNWLDDAFHMRLSFYAGRPLGEGYALYCRSTAHAQRVERRVDAVGHPLGGVGVDNDDSIIHGGQSGSTTPLRSVISP